jgi:hypothetical protein
VPPQQVIIVDDGLGPSVRRLEPSRVGRLGSIHLIALGAALVVGLGLRVYGANHDLPYIYNVDEQLFVNLAMRMLWEGTLNPGWFGHPGTTLIYPTAVTYAAILKLGMYLGWFANLSEMRDYFHAAPTVFFLLPRIFNAVAGTAVIAATFLVTRTAFSSAAAAAAALLVAVMPGQVAHSHLIRTDILLSLFVLLAAWQAAKIVDGRQLRHYLLAGGLTGLAITTKYPGIIVAALVPFAHVLSGRGWLTEWWKVALAGLAALVVAFVASPYLFLDFETVLRSVQREMRSEHVSANGEGFLKNLWWYIDVQLRGQLGLPILFLAAVGACTTLFERRKVGIVVLLFPLLFLPFISSLNLRWERWVLPVLPFVAVFAAGGATFLIELALARWSQFAQSALLLVIAATASAPLAYQAWQDDRTLMGADTRNLAGDWILNNIEPGKPILMEAYTPQLPRGVYRLFDIRKAQVMQARSPFANSIPGFGTVAGLRSFDKLRQVEYVVLGSFYGRFQAEADRYGAKLRKYEKLFSVSEVVYHVEPGPEASKGPPIRVLKIDPEALARAIEAEKANRADPKGYVPSVKQSGGG